MIATGGLVALTFPGMKPRGRLRSSAGRSRDRGFGEPSRGPSESRTHPGRGIWASSEILVRSTASKEITHYVMTVEEEEEGGGGGGVKPPIHQYLLFESFPSRRTLHAVTHTTRTHTRPGTRTSADKSARRRNPRHVIIACRNYGDQ